MECTITALSVQKRNPQRVNIYLDGEYAFGLARIVAAWLHVGQALSDEKIAQLKMEDGQEVAYQRALKLLSYRPRSEAEIRLKLKRHGTEDRTVEQVLERLQKNGLVDDAQFARIWVENRSAHRPRSQRALAYELRQRGIEAQMIEEVVQAVDNQELAYQAANKQARKLRELECHVFRQKMFAFLARRGFSYEDSLPAVNRVWAELDETRLESHGLGEVNR